jgi:hypothetical protein
MSRATLGLHRKREKLLVDLRRMTVGPTGLQVLQWQVHSPCWQPRATRRCYAFRVNRTLREK